jgi:hypothetical protein
MTFLASLRDNYFCLIYHFQHQTSPPPPQQWKHLIYSNTKTCNFYIINIEVEKAILILWQIKSIWLPRIALVFEYVIWKCINMLKTYNWNIFQSGVKHHNSNTCYNPVMSCMRRGPDCDYVKRNISMSICDTYIP